MAETIEVRGLSNLKMALDRIEKNVRYKLIMRALHDGARIVRDEAKRQAPRGEGIRYVGKKGTVRMGGRLKANIVEHASRSHHYTVVVRVRNKGFRRNGKSIVFNQPGTSPGYWWLVEFGHSGKPAHPFMRTAWGLKKGEAFKAIVESLKRGIEAVAKSQAPA